VFILFHTVKIKSGQSGKIRTDGNPSIISPSDLFRVTCSWF